MEDKNPTRGKSMWTIFGLLGLCMGLVVALALPGISATSKLFLLGSGLIAAGVWGRRRIGQG
jgi:hypothetical protein